jgi:cell division protein FtsX
MRATYPAHLVVHIIILIWRVQLMKLLMYYVVSLTVIFPSGPFSRTSPVHILSLMWETKFHINTKLQEKLRFGITPGTIDHCGRGARAKKAHPLYVHIRFGIL